MMSQGRQDRPKLLRTCAWVDGSSAWGLLRCRESLRGAHANSRASPRADLPQERKAFPWVASASADIGTQDGDKR